MTPEHGHNPTLHSDHQGWKELEKVLDDPTAAPPMLSSVPRPQVDRLGVPEAPWGAIRVRAWVQAGCEQRCVRSKGYSVPSVGHLPATLHREGPFSFCRREVKLNCPKVL